VATITSHSPEQTLTAGCALGASLTPGSVIALCGDLGAGKTQFVKGLAIGLGCDARVTSPTFTLLHEYPGGRLPLYHFDFYRLETEGDLLQIGLDDYLESGGVLAIEWADKFPALLPARTLWFDFHATAAARTITQRPSAP